MEAAKPKAFAVYSRGFDRFFASAPDGLVVTTIHPEVMTQDVAFRVAGKINENTGFLAEVVRIKYTVE